MKAHVTLRFTITARTLPSVHTKARRIVASLARLRDVDAVRVNANVVTDKGETTIVGGVDSPIVTFHTPKATPAAEIAKQLRAIADNLER